MVDIELKHCTVVYDHPEAKSIADNNVYANLSHEIIQRKMKESITFYNKTAEVKISEEKINEIMETIKSTVTTDREANKKRLEALAESEKNNEIVHDADNKKQENIVVNEDEQRKPVSIDLENDNAPVETSAKIEEPAIPSIQKEAAQK
jgi:broad-specificity NMP kinase